MGLVAALSWEVRPLLRRQDDVLRAGALFSFSLRGEPVRLVVAGMGAENSYRAARELLERGKVRGLVTLGFAGALVDSLAPGEVVIADRVLDQQSGERFDCDGELFPVASGRRGGLLSVAGVIATAAQKHRLAEEWGAAAADMESAGVARAAAQAGVPFCAIKAITDTAAQSISIDFTRCRSEHSGLSVGRILREALRSPRSVGDVWMLARGARVAARSLAVVLSSADSRRTR
jgi:adenosylhomocysteine nucleosidase